MRELKSNKKETFDSPEIQLCTIDTLINNSKQYEGCYLLMAIMHRHDEDIDLISPGQCLTTQDLQRLRDIGTHNEELLKQTIAISRKEPARINQSEVRISITLNQKLQKIRDLFNDFLQKNAEEIEQIRKNVGQNIYQTLGHLAKQNKFNGITEALTHNYELRQIMQKAIKILLKEVNLSEICCLDLLQDTLPSTAEHSVGTAVRAVIESKYLFENHPDIARQYGLNSAEDLKKVFIWGVFHDIGKILVDSQIIHKPGKLNESEWEEMQLHPLFSELLLSTYGQYKNNKAQIGGEHHEGENEGYGTNTLFPLLKNLPLDLQPTKLMQSLPRKRHPFSAIMKLIDCLDAISQQRSYHTARSPFETLIILVQDFKELEKFDPPLFYVFFERMLRENETFFPEIYKMQSNKPKKIEFVLPLKIQKSLAERYDFNPQSKTNDICGITVKSNPNDKLKARYLVVKRHIERNQHTGEIQDVFFELLYDKKRLQQADPNLIKNVVKNKTKLFSWVLKNPRNIRYFTEESDFSSYISLEDPELEKIIKKFRSPKRKS